MNAQVSIVSDAAGFRAARDQAFANFKQDQQIHKLTKQLCKLSDQLLMQLWKESSLGKEAALIAVGGFGRGALFPYSDIDILILLPGNLAPVPESLSRKVEKFVATCWDTGLEIGSAVRTVAECVS